MVRKKKEEPVQVTQSSMFTHMNYEEAFMHYLRLCKNPENISCEVYLNVKTVIALRVFTRSNEVVDIHKNKVLPIIDRKGFLYVEVAPGMTVPIAFFKAYAFVPCPDQTFKQNYQVQYKDGRPSNLDIANLMWVRQY